MYIKKILAGFTAGKMVVKTAFSNKKGNYIRVGQTA
jgi:hypothetical protein